MALSLQGSSVTVFEFGQRLLLDVLPLVVLHQSIKQD